MSNAVFPAFSGLTWDVVRRRISSTLVVAAANLKETRIAQAEDPVYEWELTYELLRDDPSAGAYLIDGYTEMEYLMGFLDARQGSFDSFLFLDPNDNAAFDQATIPATGDGANKLFQLARQRGGNGYSQQIQNAKGAPSIYVAGVLQTSGYTIGDTGLVTFTAAPANGSAVTWTGQFYFRVRLSDDQQDFNNFVNGMWATNTAIKFRSINV